MKGVQCYELVGGIALKNYAFYGNVFVNCINNVSAIEMKLSSSFLFSYLVPIIVHQVVVEGVER